MTCRNTGAGCPLGCLARKLSSNLELDDAANQVLCYCYEGNLLALAQALERSSLLWPDGKLTLPRVEQAVNDAAHFTPFHWVDTLLMGKMGAHSYSSATASGGLTGIFVAHVT